MDWEKITLDAYEQEIEDNIEKAQRVENFPEWKILVEKAAGETVRALEKKKLRVTLEFTSAEQKEKAIQLLKSRFGEELKIVGSN